MHITRYTHPLTQNFGCPPAPFFARRFSGDFENEISRMLESVFNFDSDGGLFPLDIYEDKDNTYVRAELPGVDRKNISVEVVDGTLEISATRNAGSGENAEKVSFKRAVSLPENTQADAINAAAENGVLTVTLPKQEAAKPRKFTVSVN